MISNRTRLIRNSIRQKLVVISNGKRELVSGHHQTKINQISSKKYALPSTEVAFKYMMNNNKSAVKSFLESFMPMYLSNDIVSVKRLPNHRHSLSHVASELQSFSPGFTPTSQHHEVLKYEVLSNDYVSRIIDLEVHRRNPNCKLHAHNTLALYDLCATYVNQAKTKKLKSSEFWYDDMKPVATIQIIDNLVSPVPIVAQAIKDGVGDTMSITSDDSNTDTDSPPSTIFDNDTLTMSTALQGSDTEKSYGTRATFADTVASYDPSMKQYIEMTPQSAIAATADIYRDILKHIEQDGYIKNFVFEDVSSGDRISDISLVQIDLSIANILLHSKGKAYESYSSRDWWMDLFLHSRSYDELSLHSIESALKKSSPIVSSVPSFFRECLHRLNMELWPASVQSAYHEELKGIHGVVSDRYKLPFTSFPTHRKSKSDKVDKGHKKSTGSTSDVNVSVVSESDAISDEISDTISDALSDTVDENTNSQDDVKQSMLIKHAMKLGVDIERDRVAAHLLGQGVSVSVVQSATGLSTEQVNAIASELSDEA